jgi:Activator of Hsp90 ATPase homolog 1-like protein
VSTPAGLDRWWTLTSKGSPDVGREWELFFGAAYDWRAQVSRSTRGREFELVMGKSDRDWTGTRVGFELSESSPGVTQVRFHHSGWPEANDHYRTSSFCWAMYLRLLRLWLERGESVPYDRRLSV